MKKISVIIFLLISFSAGAYMLLMPKKCSGSKVCTACKNCKGCKHCAKQGGTCGACK